MATTNYHTVDRVILGQTASGVRTQFLSDALGSVTCTVADDGSTQNTYRYKPYGGALAKTGVASDPKFAWVGGWGYRTCRSAMPSHYVRARHYDSSLSTWSSIDKLWPSVKPYAYAGLQPISRLDPTGLAPCDLLVKATFGYDCSSFSGYLKTPLQFCRDCYGGSYCLCGATVDSKLHFDGTLTGPFPGLPCDFMGDVTCSETGTSNPGCPPKQRCSFRLNPCTDHKHSVGFACNLYWFWGTIIFTGHCQLEYDAGASAKACDICGR